jgi:hypothetical protein
MIGQKVESLYPELRTGRRSSSDVKIQLLIGKLREFNQQLNDYDRLPLQTEISQLRFYSNIAKL